jgi:hypothetical protein
MYEWLYKSCVNDLGVWHKKAKWFSVTNDYLFYTCTHDDESKREKSVRNMLNQRTFRLMDHDKDGVINGKFSQMRKLWI